LVLFVVNKTISNKRMKIKQNTKFSIFLFYFSMQSKFLVYKNNLKII
jgi:hypothetical protein